MASGRRSSPRRGRRGAGSSSRACSIAKTYSYSSGVDRVPVAELHALRAGARTGKRRAATRGGPGRCARRSSRGRAARRRSRSCSPSARRRRRRGSRGASPRRPCARASQHSLTLAPYPTTSPRQTTRSGRCRSSAASDCGQRLEVGVDVAEMIPMRMRRPRPDARSWMLVADRPASTRGRRSNRSTSRSSKCGKLPRLREAGPDLVARERPQPLQGELLHGEAGEHAPEHDGAAHASRGPPGGCGRGSP